MREPARSSRTRDMTEGPILPHLIGFAVPLLFGNIFQMLYNTVDTLVVGNFVGKEALAAIGSTTMIVNIMIFFFNGVAIGAGVVISQFFGAREEKKLHSAVETTMAVTFLIGAVFTVLGILGVPMMLRLMSTPDDVFDEAATYLRIYFAGSIGLCVYNMGSGILRAVGDTKRPLYFLIFTSLLNTVLDLIFVIPLKWGIAGAGWATIISQFISAFMVLALLTRSDTIYRLTWHDLRIDGMILRRILAIGLPAGIQSMLTSFSNVFVQSYVNGFGSSCMAGWSCYNKLDAFVFLPINSLNQSASTFVSQNVGAGKVRRAYDGSIRTVAFTMLMTAILAAGLYIFAPGATALFTQDPSVIEYGVLFLRMNTFFLIFSAANNVLAGSLRGRGDSRGPMIIMLSTFVALRQIYLFVATRIAYTPQVVGIGYPVGWASCAILMFIYFLHKWSDVRENRSAA